MTTRAAGLREQIIELLPSLRRFAYALTGSRHDGDDLLQATVERLLLRGAPADAHLLKWSFRVCKNIWIDEIRARKVRNNAADDDVMPGARSEDGERIVMNSVTLDEVHRAMDTLTHDQRAALSLVALEDYSYAEAAAALDVPVGTIMSRVSRARRGLAKILNPLAEAAS